jgi:predicted DCC family thiol-disulfide oxidoreductase YuxK
MALALALAWSALCTRDTPLARASALGALAVHALLPRGEYGSLAARGRVDPGGGWSFPPRLFALVWILFAAGHAASGIAHLAEVPAVGALPLREAWRVPVGALELAVGLLALARRTRPAAWCLGVALQLPALAVGWPTPAFGMLLLSGLALDPGWIRGRARELEDLVFYDGSCGLCHRFVRLVLAEDAAARFRFAPLASTAFERAWPADVRATLPDSVVVASGVPGAPPLVRSDAVLHVLARLGGLWRVLAVLARPVPRPLRDAAYDAVARGRKRLFAEPEATCPLLPPELAARFDLDG